MQTKPQPRSNQEAFNNVWQHFIVENHPQARTEQGYCRYRTSNGLACAIGCQVPDKLVSDSDDNTSLGILLEQKWKAHFAYVDPILLSELQGIHDSSDDYEELKERLTLLAADHGLCIPGEAYGPEAAATV